MTERAVLFEFGDAHHHAETRTKQTRQGDTLAWTIPHVEVPLMCNGHVVGYVECHLHAAWAPDGVPDTSFGVTSRINTAELGRALGYRLEPAGE